MKRSPLPTRKSPLKRSQKPLKRSRIKARPPGVIDLTTREQLRERAENRCMRCRRSDFSIRCDAHHKLLKSQGGTDDLTNLAYLCRNCHQHAHLYPLEAQAEGWIISRNPTSRA